MQQPADLNHVERFSPLFRPTHTRGPPVRLHAMPSYEQPIEHRGKRRVQLPAHHYRTRRAPSHASQPRFAAHDQRVVHTPEWRTDRTAGLSPAIMDTSHQIAYHAGQRVSFFH